MYCALMRAMALVGKIGRAVIKDERYLRLRLAPMAWYDHVYGRLTEFCGIGLV